MLKEKVSRTNKFSLRRIRWQKKNQVKRTITAAREIP